MSEKDFNLLMELAKKKREQGVSKEEAIRSLQRVGILDADGNPTEMGKYFDSYIVIVKAQLASIHV